MRMLHKLIIHTLGIVVFKIGYNTKINSERSL